MSKQANPTVIGGFVLGALILLVLAILAFGSGALLRARVPMVTFFPGSVQGLSVGAQVQFEGVTVGRVTGIELYYAPDTRTFSVPVTYEVWPESVRIQGTSADDSADEILRRMVKENGLHARLESLSFVTGQYYIALQLVPGRAPRLVQDPGDRIEVPALEATRDKVTEMLENLRIDELANEAALTLASLRQLIGSGEVARLLATLEETLGQAARLLVDLDREIRPLAGRLDATLTDYAELARTLRDGVAPITRNLEVASAGMSGLMQRLDAQVEPIGSAALRALDETEAMMREIRTFTQDASVTRARLDQLLNETSAAARSLRSFADQIDRHPEVLLRGRR